VKAWNDSDRHQTGLMAAGVAFYAFLAVVPTLAVLVLTYGLVAEPSAVAGHIQALAALMPADAASIVAGQLVDLIESAAGQKGIGLLIAMGVSIYGAMRGASALIMALNVVYEVAETRSFVRKTVLALLLTLAALGALLLATAAIGVLGFLEALLPGASPALRFGLRAAFWIGAASAVSLGIALVYRYVPHRPRPKWRWLTPGSAAATLGWIAATLGFGFYVANFGNYNATYGSLGAVVVFLTWLYFCAFILLMGAEFNQALERETECDTRA